MRLNLARLGILQNAPGTAGTAGTANVYAGIAILSAGTAAGTAGTKAGTGPVESESAPALFPVFPQLFPVKETEIANVYAAVPAVPAVPGEKCRNRERGVPEQSPARASEMLALQDHTFWADDFGKWALAECTFSDRWFTAVKALHSGFCDWCLAQGTVGCMLETFEALLESEGFLIAGGLVSGLALKADVEALTSSNGRKAAKR